MTGLAALSIGARLTGAKAVLAKIPPRVWYALAAVALLIGGVIYHHHQVRKHDAALIAAEDARIAKQALALKAKVDALTAKLTIVLRSKNDEAHASIAADAGALSLRGPGKAVCPGSSVAAATPVRHDQAAPAPSPAGSSLSPADGQDMLAAVPWGWLTNLAKEHDECLIDKQSVIDQHAQMVAAWPKEAPPPR